MRLKRPLLAGIITLSLGHLAEAGATTVLDIRKDFVVTLPTEKRPMPEPLPVGTQPGFKFRGTKGWAWTPEQYLAEIPTLVKFKMNFLMNCYSSLWDQEIRSADDWRKFAKAKRNRWWEALPEAKTQGFEKVIRACQANGIEFCFSVNPNLFSTRIVNDGATESIDLLWQHYAWAQGMGVKWFSLALDDATRGIDASSQAKVANEIFRRLRAKDPSVQLIFCPTFYHGDGTWEKSPPDAPRKTSAPGDEPRQEYQPYLESLARELDKDIYCFWTGNATVGKVTRAAAEGYRARCGHRLFLWDNYPVNDGKPTLSLGPLVDRDLDLHEVVDGYMSNPHCTQNEINRVPLAMCADYAYNPTAYDPVRSIGQAILHHADTKPQQDVLKDLVEAYPGFLIYGRGGTGLNAVREQYQRIAGAPHAHLAAHAYLDFVRQLSVRMKQTFPTNYGPEKKTLDDDIAFLSEKFNAQYGKTPSPSDP